MGIFSSIGTYLYNKRNFLVPLPSELREHPAGRTQRTPLTQKFKDTFRAFFGTLPGKLAPTPGDPTRGRLGIFDYLTLGIPRLLTIGLLGFADYLDDHEGKIPQFLRHVPGALGCLVHFVANVAVRGVIAAVATTVVSPIVILTHLVSWLVGAKQYNEALQLRGVNTQSLDNFLKSTGVNANDLRLSRVDKVDRQGTAMMLFRLLPQGASGNNIPTFDFAVPVPLPVPQNQQQQNAQVATKAASLRAIGALNMFKMTTRVHDHSNKVAYGNTDADEATAALREATAVRIQ